MKITGKVALVTGAGGQGIGRAIAAKLFMAGARSVALIDKNEQVYATAEMFNLALGRQAAIPCCGDVTDASFFVRELYRVQKLAGAPPQIAVLAAGVSSDGLSVFLNKKEDLFSTYSVSQLRHLFELNVFAVYSNANDTFAHLLQWRKEQGFPAWKKEDDPIFFAMPLSSVYGLKGDIGLSGYCASKAAILVGAMAQFADWARFGGVCEALCPGFMNTPLIRVMSDDTIRKHILPFIEARRLLEPEEVAEQAVRRIAGLDFTMDIAGGHDKNRPPIPSEELILAPLADPNAIYDQLAAWAESNGNGTGNGNHNGAHSDALATVVG